MAQDPHFCKVNTCNNVMFCEELCHHHSELMYKSEFPESYCNTEECSNEYFGLSAYCRRCLERKLPLMNKKLVNSNFVIDEDSDSDDSESSSDGIIFIH